MHIHEILLDRHREIRPPWRILMFVTLLIAVSFAFLAPLSAFGGGGKVLPLVFVLLATLVASAIMTRFVHRKPAGAFGVLVHRSTMKEFVLGAGLGFVMMAGIFLVEYGTRLVTPEVRDASALALAGVFLMGALEFFLAAAVEEVLFRGYLFQVLIQWTTLLPATAIMGVLFAFAHASNPGVGALSYLNIGLVSITLSLAYYKTRGLWLPIGIHFGWNFSQTTLFGFPTSGLPPDARSLCTIVQTGPEWLTGGSFGPEGGLLATVAVGAATWYLLKSPLVRAEQGIVTLDSLEDVLPETAVGTQ